MRTFHAFLIGIICMASIPAIAEECPYIAAQLENYKKGQDINKFIKYDCLMDNAKWQTKETPLGWAVGGMNKCNGNYDAVEAILEKRPDLATSMDYDNRWAIISHSITSCCGNYNEAKCGPNPQYKIAKLLIENGADINAQTRNVFDNKDLKGKFIKNKQGTLLDVVRMHIEHCSDSTETCKQIEQLLLQHNAIATWSNIDDTPAPRTNNGNNSSGTGGTTTPPPAPTTPGTITANATNKTLTYNGNAQSCANVKNISPSDARVTYSNSQNGSYSSDITMTNVGTMTVYYKVEKDNYTTVSGSYTCKISENAIVAEAPDKTLEHTGKAQSCANVTVTSPDGATVKYSKTANGKYTTTAPTITNVGSITVYYKVEKANYTTASGSYTCTVSAPQEKEIAVEIPPRTWTYDGKSRLCIIVVKKPESGVTVKYKDKPNGKFATGSISVKDVESKTIYYQVSAKGYTTKEGNFTCAITPAKGKITVKDSDKVIKPTNEVIVEFPNPGSKKLSVECSEKATPSVTSEDTSIATTSASGQQITLTPVKEGTTTIKVTCPQTKNYTTSETTFNLKAVSNVGRITVSGVVLTRENQDDENSATKPVPYASVAAINENKELLKYNNNVLGTTTDDNGRFTLKNVPQNAKIRVTNVTYAEQIVDADTNLTIYMNPNLLREVRVTLEHKDGDPCCVKATIGTDQYALDAYKHNKCDVKHIIKGEWYKINNEWVCLAKECEDGFFVNEKQECQEEQHEEGAPCQDSKQHIKSGTWHQLGPNKWICIPTECTAEYYQIKEINGQKQCISDHEPGDDCSNTDPHIKEGYWDWDTTTNVHQWVCKATKCVRPYVARNSKCVIDTENADAKPQINVFDDINPILKKHFNPDDDTVWKDEEGKFNTARLVSDSVASVVLGTVGGVVTSSVIKKNQLKKGFESLKCTISGQTVATYGDEFNVNLNGTY